MDLRRKTKPEQPRFSATTPHFVKIIPAKTSTDTKLRIPKKFVSNYGQNLTNPICLKLPSGAEWEVQVTKCDGEVWFDKNWTDFSEFYSLNYGDLLVFRYEGNSKFHVCIFDKSATEIDYPITSTAKKEEEEEEESDADRRDKYRSPLPHKRKIMSTSSRTHSLTEDEKTIALQRADGFESEKPHFKVVLQPSYIKSMLVLPREFVKEHLIKQPAGNIMLKVSNRVSWPVYFKYAVPKARFQLGWSEFVRDNNLKIGDVCVFILIDDGKLSFQVVFYRNTEAVKCALSPAGKCKMGKIDAEQVTQSASNPSALEAANKFISRNPF